MEKNFGKNDDLIKNQAGQIYYVLAELGKKLNGTSSQTEAARIIAEAADKLLGWDACTLDLYDSKSGRIRPIINFDILNGKKSAVTPQRHDVPPTPMQRKLLKEGAKIILRHDPNENLTRLIPFGNKKRRSMSLLFVPLASGNKILGFFSIQSYKENAYDEEDLKLLQVLADYCGSALHRLQMENALKESELQYRSLIERIPDGLYRSTPDGRFLLVNPALVQMLGYDSEEEVLQLDIPTELYFDPREREEIHRLMAKGKLHSTTIRLKKKDGSELWVEEHGRIEYNKDGTPVYFEGVLRDVTARHKYQEEQKKREEKFKAQQKALVKLAMHKSLAYGDLDHALNIITEVAAKNLQVERVSVWFFNEDRTRLKCVNLYELSKNEHSAGLELTASEYPQYFKALMHQRIIDVDDVYVDYRTKDFSASYMKPYNVGALIDAPVRIAGELIGVVCHEHVGSFRKWTIEEKHFASAIADIVVHAYEQWERRKTEEQLKKSLKEKEILIQEIHHRVKNNLQIISSMLNLQLQKAADRETRELFNECQARVKSMALVHEKLYQTSDLSQINMEDYIKSITRFLFRLYGIKPESILLKMDVEKIFMCVNTAIPCGLIINELVSNALKYAFPKSFDQKKKQKELTIELFSTNNKITLRVADNGIGLSDNGNLPSNQSLGLRLVRTLTQQLGGTLTIQTLHGTECCIQFRKEKKTN